MNTTTSPDTVLRLTLTAGQVQAVINALAACPYNDVADLIAVIRDQAIQQIAGTGPATGEAQP